MASTLDSVRHDPYIDYVELLRGEAGAAALFRATAFLWGRLTFASSARGQGFGGTSQHTELQRRKSDKK